ncbi:MAG: L-lactate dehydrogenase [Candidatus Omnitrophica bacterium]|nr:L-lactate dehydrogenase [Candidatus Omnitrophota bacterium]
MKNIHTKVSIIGAGSVGSTFAFHLMSLGIAREIVLVDKDADKAAGQSMDLNHGCSFTPPVNIYSAGFEACAGSDIVVLTAGASQKKGQSRTDLVQKNTDIFKQIIPQITKHAADAILLVVTNPVDILSYVTMKISGLPPEKVIGSGTVLDTSRFRYLLSEHCGVDARNIHAYIIGEHGDTELPVWSNANIGGVRIERYCPTCKNRSGCDREKELRKLFENVKKAAYRIIDAKGATYYAIALALGRIVVAMLRNESSVLPVSTLINGYYGIDDVYLSLPSVVGKNGAEQFLRLDLSEEEREKLQHSAGVMKKIIRDIDM